MRDFFENPLIYGLEPCCNLNVTPYIERGRCSIIDLHDRALGRDGQTPGTLSPGPTVDGDGEIVFSNGQFTAYPEGGQSGTPRPGKVVSETERTPYRLLSTEGCGER